MWRMRGIKHHWYLVFAAYSFLNWEDMISVQIEGTMANLGTVDQRCRRTVGDLLRKLVSWIHKQLVIDDSAERVLQLLLPIYD